MKETVNPSKSSISRRSFLGKSLAVGAGTIGAGLLANVPTARASGGLTSGDEAIVRLLAAAELIEADLWQQYNELGGIQTEVPGGTGIRPILPPFRSSMGTCRNTFTTTPTMRLLTQGSLMRIWPRKAPNPSIWINFAP